MLEAIFKLHVLEHFPILLDIVCLDAHTFIRDADALPTVRLQKSIEAVIPGLIALLKNGRPGVPAAVARALSSLAGHGAF